jgi:Protein of unknown function (DUF2442)
MSGTDSSLETALAQNDNVYWAVLLYQKVGGKMINPRVKAVKPNAHYTLTLIFTNDEVKFFDVKPYLAKGIFRELKDLKIFNSVKPILGSIQWINGQDFCPDTLYLDSVAATSNKLASKMLEEKALVH